MKAGGFSWLVLLTMWALGSCQSGGVLVLPDPSVSPLSPATAPLATQPDPVEQILETGASISSPTAGSTEEPAGHAVTPLPPDGGLTPAQNLFLIDVCSPLRGFDLAELPEIISSPYAPPPAGKEDRHHGVDFAFYRRGDQLSIQGTEVQAVLPGVVGMALSDSFPYGNVVIVESDPAIIPEASINRLQVTEGDSLYILYAHLEDAPQVETGQEVTACQLLGAVGKSGNAGVAHLHLETRLGPGGISFESMGYYLAGSTGLEKENYLRWRIGGEFNHFNPMIMLIPNLQP